jgi:hypothetical protein
MVETKQTGKAAMAAGKNLRCIGALNVTGYALYGGIAGIDVDP